MVLDSASARKKIESITDLPTLPTVASQIVSIANNPKASATDVGSLISHDQALTGKVLKLVNSAFYGFPQQIKTINHAIVILGFSKVKNVVITASVFDLTKGSKGKGLNIGRFWEHSLGCAIVSQVVAQHLGHGLSPDDAFVAGLLHDIGKLILDQHLSQDYMGVFEYSQKENSTIRKAEKEILGFDHTQVGQWIAEKWKLPASLVTPIRYHHTPNLARDERDMTAAVHLGNIITRAMGIGNSGDNFMSALSTQVMEQHFLKTDFFQKVIDKVAEELKKATEFFELIDV